MPGGVGGAEPQGSPLSRSRSGGRSGRRGRREFHAEAQRPQRRKRGQRRKRISRRGAEAAEEEENSRRGTRPQRKRTGEAWHSRGAGHSGGGRRAISSSQYPMLKGRIRALRESTRGAPNRDQCVVAQSASLSFWAPWILDIPYSVFPIPYSLFSSSSAASAPLRERLFPRLVNAYGGVAGVRWTSRGGCCETATLVGPWQHGGAVFGGGVSECKSPDGKHFRRGSASPPAPWRRRCTPLAAFRGRQPR